VSEYIKDSKALIARTSPNAECRYRSTSKHATQIEVEEDTLKARLAQAASLLCPVVEKRV